jgi:hypothetical protein
MILSRFRAHGGSEVFTARGLNPVKQFIKTTYAQLRIPAGLGTSVANLDLQPNAPKQRIIWN